MPGKGEGIAANHSEGNTQILDQPLSAMVYPLGILGRQDFNLVLT